MLPYDRAFSPPAPVITVEVFKTLQPEQRQTVPAKLDTAADISAVPLRVIQQLALKSDGEIELAGYDNVPASVSTYLVGLELPNARIRRIDVVPIAENYALLGRDVLNLFHITLNGPELDFDLR